MRRHSISSSENVLHRSPDVVFRSGLLVPDVSSIAIEMTRLESLGDIVSVADGAAGCVNEPGPLTQISYVRQDHTMP